MNKVTSMTILTTAEGKRISLTYSQIDQNGNIIKENERINRVVMNNDALACIAELEDFAQNIVDSQVQ